MVILVTYDLRKPAANYTRLFEALKSYGVWWHNLDSTWLIETTQTSRQVIDSLLQCIDKDDRLFVIEVKKNWWGFGLPQSAYDWITARNF